MSKKLEKRFYRNKEEPNGTFEYLFETYQGLVRHFSATMFNKMNREDFEDCFWMRVHQMVCKGRFENVENESAFLYEILRRVYWELLRKQEVQLKTVDVAYLSNSLLSKTDSPEEVILKREELISRKELAEDIVEYVKTLKPPLPVIFDYYFIQGRNSRWIAQKTHINRNTIRGQLRKVRISIKERFKGHL